MSVVSSLLSEVDATKDDAHREDTIRNVAGAAYAGQSLHRFHSDIMSQLGIIYRWYGYGE